MLIISLAFSLFLLMNPVGNVPLFLGQLKGFSPKRQRTIILRELLIALIIMLLFMFFGRPLLKILNIDHYALYFSGGITLFIIAIKMIFPAEKETTSPKQLSEPLIVPLAVPLVAGPAILASVILYSGQVPSLIYLISAIFIAWFLSCLILLSSSQLSKILGNRGLIACERLMGLILTLTAVQMFLNGINLFFKQPPQ